MYIGDCYLNEGDFDKAIENYKNAVKINPDDYRCHFFQATALFKQQKVDEALEQYAEALTLKPNHKNIENVLTMLQPVFNFKFNKLDFEPKALTLKKEDGVNIYLPDDVNAGWVGYAASKAVWLGEESIPNLKESGSSTNWSLTSERQAIYSLLSAYSNDVEKNPSNKSAELDQLLQITNEGHLSEYILYVIGSKMDPHITLRIDPKFRSNLKEFILKYIIQKNKA